jgi:hypothetical protein
MWLRRGGWWIPMFVARDPYLQLKELRHMTSVTYFAVKTWDWMGSD